MKYNELDEGDLKIAYWSSGEEHAQKMLFVHGNPGRWNDFNEDALNQLSEHFHVVSFDRPGHGKSKSKEYGFEANLRAVDALAKKLSWEQFSLAGYSWGAAFSLYYANQKPERINSLLLINPWAYPRPEEKDPSSSLKALRLPGAFSLMRSKIDAQLREHFEECFAPLQPSETYVSDRKLDRDNVLAMLNDKASLLQNLEPLTKHYSNINVKTLILAAKDDRVCPFATQAERLYQDLPHASLLSEAKGSHAIPFIDPQNMIRNAMLLREESRHVVNH